MVTLVASYYDYKQQQSLQGCRSGLGVLRPLGHAEHARVLPTRLRVLPASLRLLPTRLRVLPTHLRVLPPRLRVMPTSSEVIRK